MKFHCPHCDKYSTLDQEKTPVLERAGFITCLLCKKKAFVSIRLLPSKSDARRVLTQMGVDLKAEDPGLYVKEPCKHERTEPEFVPELHRQVVVCLDCKRSLT